jgi:hypothetical protein
MDRRAEHARVVGRAASLVVAGLALGSACSMNVGPGPGQRQVEGRYSVGEHIIQGNPLLAWAFAHGTGDERSVEMTFRQRLLPHDLGWAGSVQLTRLSLTIAADSATRDFDWLDEVHITLEPVDRAGQGSGADADRKALPALEVARAMAVPSGVDQVELEVLPVELSDYMDDEVQLVARARVRPPEAPVVWSGDATLMASD